VWVLHQALCMLSPYMPFVTQEIYSNLRELVRGETPENLWDCPWPTRDASAEDGALDSEMNFVQQVVTQVRTIRAEMNVPPGKRAPVLVKTERDELTDALAHHKEHLAELSKAEGFEFGTDVKKPPLSGSAVVSGAEIYVPLEGIIDVDRERSRLKKELDKMTGLLGRTGKKLQNQAFLAQAPKEVVAAEERKQEDYQSRVEKLTQSLEQLLGW